MLFQRVEVPGGSVLLVRNLKHKRRRMIAVVNDHELRLHHVPSGGTGFAWQVLAAVAMAFGAAFAVGLTIQSSGGSTASAQAMGQITGIAVGVLLLRDVYRRGEEAVAATFREGLRHGTTDQQYPHETFLLRGARATLKGTRASALLQVFRDDAKKPLLLAGKRPALAALRDALNTRPPIPTTEHEQEMHDDTGCRRSEPAHRPSA